MDPQLVDWGGSAVLLGIFWQLMAWSMRRLTRRLDRQDEDLAELKADMKAGQAELKGGQVRLEDHIIQLAGGLGEVKGELKRIAPREKVAAGGS